MAPATPPALHVLVVDDDVVAIQGVGHALSSVARISFATTGEEALDLARQLQPHAVLLDADLPDLPGLAVCRALRRDPLTADLPVIMVTQHRAATLEAEALAAGAIDHLYKPVDPDLLRLRLLRLLRHPPASRLAGGAAGAAHEVTRAPRLLVVDDDPVTVQVVRHLVKHLGECQFALDGPSALERVRTFRPDLLLLDLGLPGLDGEAVCRAVRADPQTAHTPIVVVSQETDPARTRRAWEAGADDVLTKPFDPEVLRARTARWLRPAAGPVPGTAPPTSGAVVPRAPEAALPWPAAPGRGLDPPRSGTVAGPALRQGAPWLARRVSEQAAALQAACEAVGQHSVLPPAARSALHALQAMASDVQDLHAVEEGLLTLRVEALELGSVLDEATAVLALSAPAAGAVLSYAPHPASGRVLADRRRLQQALALVLEALLEEAPPGARLTIEVTDAPPQHAVLVLRRSPGAARVPAGGLDAYAEASTAHGLALPLAAALVRAQGGQATVESTGQAVAVKLTLARPAQDLQS